jgi:hypothetical protein
MKHLVLGVAAAVMVGWASPAAFGQAVTSPYPPGYSPYLQLINPSAGLTTNYFNLVYPQLQVANNFQLLQQQSLDTRRQLESMNSRVMTNTNTVGFNTHMKYFDSGSKRFGVNNTTNTNQRPPLTNDSLLRPYPQFIRR